MAARRRTKHANSKDVVASNSESKGDASKDQQKKELDSQLEATKAAQLAEEHLAPLPFVFTVLLCSGALWVLAFRDVFATGRIIAGPLDEAMQVSVSALCGRFAGIKGCLLSHSVVLIR